MRSWEGSSRLFNLPNEPWLLWLWRVLDSLRVFTPSQSPSDNCVSCGLSERKGPGEADVTAEPASHCIWINWLLSFRHQSPWSYWVMWGVLIERGSRYEPQGTSPRVTFVIQLVACLWWCLTNTIHPYSHLLYIPLRIKNFCTNWKKNDNTLQLVPSKSAPYPKNL